ncbi:HAAS signaling domain-containing protein [Parapedobacter koreensis]|uniref:DUF1700 domain-containing protein n=1 Tax=Parapedobacter koreensis TaxID=332977 RepID=A0A1H7JMM6_9SPHI|nr:hypothetical protein [Parapedobacter koreensis]SEK75782.1 hypothetical protein SAMN05421740_102611 [Parapedobacter koreensis]
MKMLTFNDKTANKIYQLYIKRVKKVSKGLPEEDKDDILMEINSHIYEAMQRVHVKEATEADKLLDILDRFGEPEDVLRPLIAEKKLRQATTTFNPVHIVKALALNVTNGVAYIIFSLLYLFLFTFVFVIGAKILYPKEVGLFFQDGSFYLLGIIDPKYRQKYGVEEVLGNWFIPAMLLVSVVFYVLTTLILRLVKRRRK